MIIINQDGNYSAVSTKRYVEAAWWPIVFFYLVWWLNFLSMAKVVTNLLLL